MDHRLLPVISSLSYAANQAVREKLIKRTVYAGFILRLSGSVNVGTVGAYTEEGVLKLLSNLALKDGDVSKVQIDGKGLWQLNKMLLGHAPGVLTEPDTAGSTGVKSFAVDMYYPFGHLRSGAEELTYLDTGRLANPVFEVQWGGDSDLSAAVGTVSASLKVLGDEFVGAGSLFSSQFGTNLERFSFYPKQQPITGAVSGLSIELLKSNPVRGLLLRTVDNAGALSNSIVSAFKVRERTSDVVVDLSWSEAQAINRMFHLDGVAPDTGYCFVDFLKLSRNDMRDPRGLDAFELVIDAAAAGTLSIYHVMESRKPLTS